MRSGFRTVCTKELRRFFTDKRMVFTSIILPGVMIFLIYSFMGTAMREMLTTAPTYVPTVYAVNMPESVKTFVEKGGLSFIEAAPDDVNNLKAQVANKELDLLAVFPSNFEEDVLAAVKNPSNTNDSVDAQLSQQNASTNVKIFYNSTRTESRDVYARIVASMNAYRASLVPSAAPPFSINASVDSGDGTSGATTGGGTATEEPSGTTEGSASEGSATESTATESSTSDASSTDGSGDLATARDITAFSFAAFLPLLIMIFLFSGCMAVAAESIAGEKERGTIATMLITPLKRWQLALGKVVSISCIALLAGLSSFIGTMAALPSMIGAGMDSGTGAVTTTGAGAMGTAATGAMGAATTGAAATGAAATAATTAASTAAEATTTATTDATAIIADTVGSALIYSVSDYLLLLLVTLSTVLLFVGLISVISALAKTVKEAGTLVTPLMILVMLVGVLGMFSATAVTDPLFYLVPVYNSVQCFVGIFGMSANLLQVLITTAVNLAITGICVVVLARMFNSERILFMR